MKNIFMFSFIFVLIIVNIFSQNLQGDRMIMYNEFGEICDAYSEFYVRLWVSREPEYINAKNNTERNNFARRMFLRYHAAWEKSKRDFRDRLINNEDFKNSIKNLLEQLNNQSKNGSILSQWTILLHESGYAVTADDYNNAYNNIELFGYNLIFLVNSCMLLDQEFPDNNIVDSILERTVEHFNQT
jgi:hypothetical protein